MSIGENIRKYRRSKGMSLDELAKGIGVSRQTMSRYETGVIANIPSDNIEKIARRLDISPAHIMGWTDAASQEKQLHSVLPFWAVKDPGPLPSNAMPYTAPVHIAPILGHIPAGCPLLATEDILGYAPIEFSDEESYFWLSVSGDSMINAGIHTGDLVLIRKQPCADDGQIVAARVNGDEATLKRFRRSGDTVMLVPENPKYTPIPVPASAFETGDASIIGVVVELKRKFI